MKSIECRWILGIAALAIIAAFVLPIVPMTETVVIGSHLEKHASKFEVETSQLEPLINASRIVGARFHVWVRNTDNRSITVNVEYTPTYSNGLPVQYVLQGYMVEQGASKDLYYDFVVGHETIALFGKIVGDNSIRVSDGSPLIRVVMETTQVTKYRGGGPAGLHL